MSKPQSKIQNLKSKIDWLLLLPLIFIPRLLDLNVFLTADEPLFLAHARQFAAGLSSGNFSQTLGIGYPGVTVAGWAAPAVSLFQTEWGAYVAGRAALALLTGLLLLALYGQAKLLWGREPALIAVILLALDPYTLAYSRLLHIAAPLALFITLAGLSSLLWLRHRRNRWLLLTGLFGGLALLTKSTALLLGPMLGALVLGWAVTAGAWRNGRWWLRVAGGLLAAGGVSAIIFFALWPAMWVDPWGALSLTFGKLLNDQEAGAGNLGMFWLGQFAQDPGPLFYPVAFLLKSTPWLLVGLFLSVACGVGRSAFPLRGTWNVERGTCNLQPATLALWLFALTYLVIMTIASKKSIRYMLPAFPVFYLLAGLAFHQMGQSLVKYLQQRSPITNYQLPQIIAIITVTAFALFYHPYYFTYYNPLALGWRWAPNALLVGWGEGLDVAARYLNERPPARVSAWYEWLFPLYYHGQTEPVVPPENLITADYSVLYINQVQRNIPGPNIIHYFRARRQPEYTVTLAGVDYAWVYPGPIAGFRPDPAPQYPLAGEFGSEARLLGYNLRPQPAAGGQSLIITLYWQALATPPAGRFVYLRLVDEQGHIWARADSPPVMGLWPSTRWQPDMLIEDAHELPIPPGTPPGNYRLEVGLYDPGSGQPLPAGGQPLGQGGGLLLGQVPVEWRATQTAPDLPHRTETELASNVHLIGYDSPPSTATTGDVISLRLAWREAAAWFQGGPVSNPAVRFEWFADDVSQAAQQSALPLPVTQWGNRAVLLSRHDVIVPPQLAPGGYTLRVGLFNNNRPTGDSFSLGTVEVTAPPHRYNLPAEAAAPAGSAHLSGESGQTVTLSGYSYRLADNGLDLQLYWQTDAPLTTRYKVFAQLLAADNSLLAQSDSFPAAGERPATGWLPGEIIADPHRLNFAFDPSPGQYRLIAGLYNPLNGQRLPILNPAGQPVADAIFITEVALP